MKALVGIPGRLTVTVTALQQRFRMRVLIGVATGTLDGQWFFEAIRVTGAALGVCMCAEQRVARLGQVVKGSGPAALIVATGAFCAVPPQMHVVAGMTADTGRLQRFEAAGLDVAVTAG